MRWRRKLQKALDNGPRLCEGDGYGAARLPPARRGDGVKHVGTKREGVIKVVQALAVSVATGLLKSRASEESAVA